jgi:S-adenosylmethionine synthetase
MPYLFTSESVSEGHPDKVADQISDALIDHFLAFDPNSKVACETLVTTGQVVLAGEVKSKAYLDVQEIARQVIRRIGYTKSEYMFEVCFRLFTNNLLTLTRALTGKRKKNKAPATRE